MSLTARKRHGQRLNQDVYVQQQVTLGRLMAIAGGRFVHDSAFGNTGVPRVALTFAALRGGENFSGTRLRFSYATGFKEPRLEETLAGSRLIRMMSESGTASRSGRDRLRLGFSRISCATGSNFNATYFNNLFHDQINYVTIESGDVRRRVREHERGVRAGRRSCTAGAASAAAVAECCLHLHVVAVSVDNPAPYRCGLRSGATAAAASETFGYAMLSYLGNRWGAKFGRELCGTAPGF